MQNGCELEALLDKTKSPIGERSVTALLASEVPGAERVPEGPGFSWSCVQRWLLLLISRMISGVVRASVSSWIK